MSVRSNKKKSSPSLAPAPSVLDAVHASRGPGALRTHEGDTFVMRDLPVEDLAEDVRADEQHVSGPEATDDLETQYEADVVEEPAPRVVRTAAPTAAPTPKATTAPVAAGASSVDDLGEYVTRVMVDARRAASEFLASVDVDAHRRAATIAAQAEIEARSLREAARAEADKIRADARLEADRLVAQRLRIAIDLTDDLYRQAGQILADADRPDVARRHLAQLVTALTQTAEDAAEASVADDRG